MKSVEICGATRKRASYCFHWQSSQHHSSADDRDALEAYHWCNTQNIHCNSLLGCWWTSGSILLPSESRPAWRLYPCSLIFRRYNRFNTVRNDWKHSCFMHFISSLIVIKIFFSSYHVRWKELWTSIRIKLSFLFSLRWYIYIYIYIYIYMAHDSLLWIITRPNP